MLGTFRNRGVIFCVALAWAAPQPQLSYRPAIHDVVKHAHTMNLLPQEAVVDKTAPGIQMGYYHIKPFEKADLNAALGGSIPLDIIQSLESQVNAIGYDQYQQVPTSPTPREGYHRQRVHVQQQQTIPRYQYQQDDYYGQYY